MHPTTETWLKTLQVRARELQEITLGKFTFDVTRYEPLSRHHSPQDIARVLAGDPFQFINTRLGCLNCHQALQLDTYAKGCTHDCSFCFAREAAGEAWNRPYPLPIDITALWRTFHEVFETDRPHPMRGILSRRVPIRLGCKSDPLMHLDRKFGITLETLKLFNHYEYPFSIVTHSDLAAEDEYLRWIPPRLATVHVSIVSLDERKSRLLEPGAPSPGARLRAIRKLRDAGVWTVGRISPLFPCHADGHFSRRGGGNDSEPALDFFSFDLIDALADAGANGVLAGFLTASADTARALGAKLGADLTTLLTDRGAGAAFRYSPEEIREYHLRIREHCHRRGMEFTPCYLGGSESSYSANRDLWDNPDDCCNMKNRVAAHRLDSRGIAQPRAATGADRPLERLTGRIFTFLLRHLQVRQ